MSFSRLFIMRPVGTTLMAVAFMVAGLFAYRAMPVADLPNISVPVIYVIASQPGSSPQQLASAVTTPLERRLGQIAGVSSMRSDTTDSSAFILLFLMTTGTSTVLRVMWRPPYGPPVRTCPTHFWTSRNITRPTRRTARSWLPPLVPPPVT